MVVPKNLNTAVLEVSIISCGNGGNTERAGKEYTEEQQNGNHIMSAAFFCTVGALEIVVVLAQTVEREREEDKGEDADEQHGTNQVEGVLGKNLGNVRLCSSLSTVFVAAEAGAGVSQEGLGERLFKFGIVYSLKVSLVTLVVCLNKVHIGDVVEDAKNEDEGEKANQHSCNVLGVALFLQHNLVGSAENADDNGDDENHPKACTHNKSAAKHSLGKGVEEEGGHQGGDSLACVKALELAQVNLLEADGKGNDSLERGYQCDDSKDNNANHKACKENHTEDNGEDVKRVLLKLVVVAAVSVNGIGKNADEADFGVHRIHKALVHHKVGKLLLLLLGQAVDNRIKLLSELCDFLIFCHKVILAGVFHLSDLLVDVVDALGRELILVDDCYVFSVGNELKHIAEADFGLVKLIHAGGAVLKCLCRVDGAHIDYKNRHKGADKQKYGQNNHDNGRNKRVNLLCCCVHKM